jgi:hypothetical protein
MWLAGFVNRGNMPAEGVAEPLNVRALAIHDSAGTKVIVSADILGFTRELHEQIATLVQNEHGLPPANLVLNATHTHNGPVLRDNLDPEVTYNLSPEQLQIVSAYTDWLRDTIVDTIGEALKKPTKAILSYGVGQLTGFAIYRSTINSGLPSDLTDVPVMTIRSMSGAMLAIVFSYAVHPVNSGSDANRFLYHAEFPGVAAAQLETQFPGSVALFLQGAAGDLNPHGGAGDAFGMGNTLAEAVTAVINNVANPLSITVLHPPDPITGPIKTSYQTVLLPLDVYQQGTTLAEKDEETAVHTLLRGSYQDIVNLFTGPNAPAPNEYYRHAQKMIRAIDNYRLPDTEPLPLQVWYFQDDKPVLLVATGGELVSGYGIVIRAQAAAKVLNDPSHVWVTAYTNEVPGYIPSDGYLYCYWCGGGYEAGWSSANIKGSYVADGSQLFYGQPARLKGAVRDGSGNVLVKGVEQIVLETVNRMVNAIAP